MPHQDKSRKCYLDLGINLEWPSVYMILMYDIDAHIIQASPLAATQM